MSDERDREVGTVSEDDLRQNFERYQKFLEDLNRRYAIEPVVVSSGSAGEDYTAEAAFVYEVHART